MKNILLCGALCAAGFAVQSAKAQVLYSEDFDSGAASAVRENLARGSAMELRYLNYGSFTIGSNTFSIAEAPSTTALGGAAQQGVLMRGTGSGTERILNLLPAATHNGTALTFSGDYRVKFDMYLSLDPTATTASTGTTEIGIWGVGYTSTEPLGRFYRSSATATWGWLATDGGFSGTANNGDASVRTNAGQFAILENPTQPTKWEQAWPANPDIPGTTPVQNAPWNSWTQVEITALAGSVSVKFNGVEFFSGVTGGSTDGAVVLGYEDPFTGSSSFSPDWSFGLFDNIVVEAVPEPGALSLMLLGGMALLYRRRR